MSRAATFKQADLTKALKAAIAAGVRPARVEIELKTGRIVLTMPGEEAPSDDPFDAWKAKRSAS